MSERLLCFLAGFSISLAVFAYGLMMEWWT
jgi:hypothetical protein